MVRPIEADTVTQAEENKMDWKNEEVKKDDWSDKKRQDEDRVYQSISQSETVNQKDIEKQIPVV